jgi:hypothetical protein
VVVTYRSISHSSRARAWASNSSYKMVKPALRNCAFAEALPVCGCTMSRSSAARPIRRKNSFVQLRVSLLATTKHLRLRISQCGYTRVQSLAVVSLLCKLQPRWPDWPTSSLCFTHPLVTSLRPNRKFPCSLASPETKSALGKIKR